MNESHEKILIRDVRDEGSNLGGIDFEYIKNGITIIIGENNVGKTNLLNWFFKNVDKLIWKEIVNPFLEAKVHQDNLEELNRNFINSGVIFQYPSRRKIFYSIYYLDLETSFYNFLPKKTENSKKIKYLEGELIGDYFAEVEINRRLGKQEAGWKDWIEEFSKATKREDKLDIIIEEAKEIKAINIGRLHSAKKTGSGNWKFWILKNFLHSISESNNKNKGATDGNPHICQSILLIDEPELFLHDHWIKVIANSIKNEVKKGNLTIILATHSTKFLSHFINDDLITNLVIAQKESKEESRGYLKKPLYFWKIKDEIKNEVLNYWKKYCLCFEKRIDDESFYFTKWKSILNEYTLKVFFSKKILFVEGPSDCILLTSEIIRKKVKGLEEIEIVPIFSKSNYIFFSKLAERLRLCYWTLLDMDSMDKELLEKLCRGEELIPSQHNVNKETKSCFKQLNTRFLHQHMGELDFKKIQKDEISRSKITRISWFPKDAETFLDLEREEKNKKQDDEYNFLNKHFWIKSKEMRMLDNIASDSFNKKNEERIDKLVAELNEIVDLIEKQEKKDNFYEE